MAQILTPKFGQKSEAQLRQEQYQRNREHAEQFGKPILDFVEQLTSQSSRIRTQKGLIVEDKFFSTTYGDEQSPSCDFVVCFEQERQAVWNNGARNPFIEQEAQEPSHVSVRIASGYGDHIQQYCQEPYVQLFFDDYVLNHVDAFVKDRRLAALRNQERNGTPVPSHLQQMYTLFDLKNVGSPNTGIVVKDIDQSLSLLKRWVHFTSPEIYNKISHHEQRPQISNIVELG